jgi:oligopeptide/dipeptide ABC transporter ATP-binding protein
MTHDSYLLHVKSATVSFPYQGDLVPVVDQVSFSLKKGEILGIVGESGCGKSQLALALMGLSPSQAVVHLEIETAPLTYAMIFQEPLTALNPVIKIGEQVREGLRLPDVNNTPRERVVELLRAVGLPHPEQMINQYPHELSGGMRQRVLIAMALAREPDLLIADEPTTALDVTIQAEILDLLRDLNRSQHLSMLLITHDLALLKDFAHRVIVMYAGMMVEIGTVEEIFEQPQHPYTRALMEVSALKEDSAGKFATISGSVPDPQHYPSGCRFHPRCNQAQPECSQATPAMKSYGEHRWACPYQLTIVQ